MKTTLEIDCNEKFSLGSKKGSSARASGFQLSLTNRLYDRNSHSCPKRKLAKISE